MSSIKRVVESSKWLPANIRATVISKIFGKVVPYVGTSGLLYEEITPERVVVSIKNQRKVQNHINNVHAAAMALLAETATGFVVGMNLPDDKLPLIKSLKVSYYKRTQGDMRAVATLTPEDIARIESEPQLSTRHWQSTTSIINHCRQKSLSFR
jgi:acyl-coenzyme A thioesterase PaaI-like protein